MIFSFEELKRVFTYRYAPFLFCFIGRWSELPPSPLNVYTCRVSGLAEMKLLVIDLVLSSFNILLHSMFGSLPKCNSNADFLSLVCGVVRITFGAKPNAFPSGFRSLILVRRFSFKVHTPLSTRPVGVCIYGVPYISFMNLFFAEFSKLSSGKGCCLVRSYRFWYTV